MPKDDKDKDRDKDTRRIQDLAGELARAGLPQMFDRFDAVDFAQYCLDVAQAIYAYDGAEDEDEDEDDDD